MNFIDVLFALTGLIAGFGLGWIAIRRAHDALRHEKTILATRLETAMEEEKKRGSEFEQQQREKTALHERALIAEEQNKALSARLREQQQELEKMNERLRLEFKTTAATIFEEFSNKFSTQSEKKIGDLLNPLQLHLNDFKKLVGDSFTEQGKEQRSLKDEIKRIVETNDKMRLETSNLTKALRSDVKAQGNWGEVVLETILEKSGLQKPMDYILQGKDLGLTDTEGNRQQPDVIINLPDGKHIIVDAKVSLVAYERYCSETDNIARETHLKEFLRSLKSHVTGLSEKGYHKLEKLGAPDFVFMFMPIEGAYSLAIQMDNTLHSFAWERKIAIVYPSTLFATLRTIASLWRIEKQNQNAEEIARRGGLLYDKFVGFIQDMDDIGERLEKVQKSYAGAFSKLSQGSGSLVRQVEQLKELGAKADKALPKELLAQEEKFLSHSSFSLALTAEE